MLADREREPVASPAGRRVRELIRAEPLVCDPGTTVQDAARQMLDAGVTCAVVDLGDQLGIVTDRDVRARVVAAGAGPDTPLSDVMSAPAWTVAGDRTGTEALLLLIAGIYVVEALSVIIQTISFKKFITQDTQYWSGFPTAESPTRQPLYWFFGGRFSFAGISPRA